MTDKQIIKLKPMEDLNEKIIKEKGNTKCIFYNDDICRNGDKTRDCVNCARVEYHSLYSINWDNQERLQKIIKQKEQECQQDMDNYVQLDLQRVKEYNELVDLYKAKEQECEMWKKEIINRNEKIEELRFSVSDLTNRLCDLNAEKSFRIVDLEQTLTEIKEIAEIKQKQCVFVCETVFDQILQKISECEIENE